MTKYARKSLIVDAFEYNSTDIPQWVQELIDNGKIFVYEKDLSGVNVPHISLTDDIGKLKKTVSGNSIFIAKDLSERIDVIDGETFNRLFEKIV